MHALLRQLYRWRFRERLVRMAWGAARLLAAMAVALALCCAVDYWYDRYADVPGVLRFAMLAFQATVATVLAYFFLVRPWFATPPIDDFATRAEQAIPEFDHRIVTAIQLNRKSARTDGMSPVLIAEVTREAGEMAARHRLSRLIDYSRLGWAVMVLLPIVLFWGIFLLFAPTLATALLKRQAMENVPIPRSIALADDSKTLWPAGDEVTVRYLVSGKFRESAKGTVYVQPEGQPSERYELKFHSVVAPGKALFTALIPQSSANFSYRARLQDARTHQDGTVRFEPRPTVKSVEAHALLPAYLGLIPTGPNAGQRYEQFQHQGEVVALAGSTIRVETTFEKPVVKAELVLLESDIKAKSDKVLERRPMTLSPDRLAAIEQFDLQPVHHVYRIEVEDEHGFKNATPPQRGISTMPDEPPDAQLLVEALKNPDPAALDGKGPISDYELSGLPILVGEPCRIGFHTRSTMGIDKVWIYYRINDEKENRRQFTTISLLGAELSFWDNAEVEKWNTQLLNPVTADLSVTGPFVPELGLFQRSGKRGNVELYKFPSPNPETEPGDMEAGGRYNFQTGGMLKMGPDGQLAKLEPGDRVEFYVAVRDKAPGANRKQGRSESLFKSVVTAKEMEDWKQQRRDHFKKLVEESQKGQSDIRFKP